MTRELIDEGKEVFCSSQQCNVHLDEDGVPGSSTYSLSLDSDFLCSVNHFLLLKQGSLRRCMMFQLVQILDSISLPFNLY